MRKNRKRSIHIGEKSLSIAFFFLLVVGLLVGLSIILKVFLLFHAAKFDGDHQFILEVHTPSQKQILSLDPDTSSAVILSVEGTTMQSLSKYIEMPENAEITLPKKYESLYSLAQDLLFHPSQNLPLNIIDRIRLFLFINTIKPTNITDSDWLPQDVGDDKKLIQLFADHTAYIENMNISIINSSGEVGLGNTVTQYISHIGLNVISVTSGETILDKTTLVYSGKEGYTLSRLMRIFDVSAQQSTKPMLSDITINLGKDRISKF